MKSAKDACRTHQLVTFEVVGRRYGVAKESLMAVVPLDSVEHAASDGGGNGAVRWRGGTLPVVDAGAKARRTSGSRVLIAVHGARGAVGIAADRLGAVVTYEADQVDRSAEGMALTSPLGAVATRVVDGSGRAIDCVDAATLLG